MKPCSRCRAVLPFEMFSPGNRSRKDNLHAYCKPCRSELQMARWYRKQGREIPAKHRRRVDCLSLDKMMSRVTALVPGQLVAIL